MTSADIRRSAREALEGNWIKGALLTLVYGIMTCLIAIVLSFIPMIGPILNAVISLPLAFGFLCSLIRLRRGEDVSYLSFFNDGFNSFKEVWFVQLRTILKLLPFLIGIIICYIAMAISIPLTIAEPGLGATISILSSIALLVISIAMIPKSMLYSLNQYMLFDNPNKTALEIVEGSEQLMRGNRLKLFGLQLSFIGWAILSVLTFGIGYFFLLPYMQFAIIIFYENLAGKEDLSFGSDEEVTSDDYEVVEKENNSEDITSDEETIISEQNLKDEE